MKHISYFVLPALILILAIRLPAQQAYSALHSFGQVTNPTCFQPECKLVQGPDGTLYGTTYNDGTIQHIGNEESSGNIFKVQPDGSGYTVLYNFEIASNGGCPIGAMVLNSNTLYGITSYGGIVDVTNTSLSLNSYGGGTVYSISTSGTNFELLHSFTATEVSSSTSNARYYGAPTNSDGCEPMAGLILIGTKLYGTTIAGGTNASGTVFSINLDGTGFTTLHTFGQVEPNANGILANFDGAYPSASLTYSGSTLYGTTSAGGTNGNGIIFGMNLDGTGYTNIKAFTALTGSGGTAVVTNGDGASPNELLILNSNTIYGTTDNGGTNGNGTVFSINVNGSGFRTLHNFNLQNASGSYPSISLSYLGGALYGTTSTGGTNGMGSIFTCDTNGGNFTNLLNFETDPFNGNYYSNAVGAVPEAGLILDGNVLYGTASAGGTNGNGCVFAINTNGANFTVIKYLPVNSSYIDGANPNDGLTINGGVIYGTTVGPTYTLFANSGGTIYSIGTNGQGFTVLKNYGQYDLKTDGYTDFDGALPNGGLVLSSNILYGTTQGGGTNGLGTVFSMHTDGSDYTVLHHFSTNSNDGEVPETGLILNSGALYGTTRSQYPNKGGAIFKINTDGSGFDVLTYNLYYPVMLTIVGNTLFGANSVLAGGGSVFRVNTDGSGFTNFFGFSLTGGSGPPGGLVVVGSTLYGITAFGPNSWSQVFKVNIDGTRFGVLYTLTNSYDFYGISDGSTPVFSGVCLVSSGGVLYGTMLAGGDPTVLGAASQDNTSGYVFMINLDGTGYATLYSFTNTPDGSSPNGLTLQGNTLYGTTESGGIYFNSAGTLLSVVPSLSVLAFRQFPTGTWPGIGYWPGVSMTNTIQANPPTGTVDYAVQDQIVVSPNNTQGNAPFTVGSINNGGTFVAGNNTIEWGPFFDNVPRTLSYVLTASPGTTNWAQFSGIISINGSNNPVLGADEFNLIPLHPADDNPPINNTININDVTAYGAAWKLGNSWPVEPNPIPISYVTSAGLIWKEGEYYVYIPTLGAPPSCWVNAVPPPGVVLPAIASEMLPHVKPDGASPKGGSISTAVCSMTNICTPGVPFTVTLTATPGNSVNVYAVEDQFPSGWSPSHLSAGGLVDSYNNKVKWGPFFYNSAQTFSYQITPPANFVGTTNFAGTASFDGAGIAITGVRQVVSSSTPPVFQQLTQSKEVLTLSWSTIPSLNYQIQYSTNLEQSTWYNFGSQIAATNSSMTASASMTNSQMFYRVMLVQ